MWRTEQRQNKQITQQQQKCRQQKKKSKIYDKQITFLLALCPGRTHNSLESMHGKMTDEMLTSAPNNEAFDVMVCIPHVQKEHIIYLKACSTFLQTKQNDGRNVNISSKQ